jgi:hypothetical protein
MANARRALGGSGSQSAALGFGGLTTANSAATEEFTRSTTKIIPGSWSGGGSMGTARYALAGAGTQTAALAFGGLQQVVQQLQKNIMELLGQQEEI